MDYLVGYTGFVGSNIALSHKFDKMFNSKNIEESFGGCPDLLVYSGVRAEMFIANKNPEFDYKMIENAIENIRKINPKKIVLISTISVYDNPVNVDELSIINEDKLLPYGKNRLHLEKWVEKNIGNHLIIRLPSIFGANLKKNFIYDYINMIPSMLTKEKMEELSKKKPCLMKYYQLQENGFFKCIDLEIVKKIELKKCFLELQFSAIDFTDSRASYQFYHLKHLWNHIEIAIENNIKKLNISSEPIVISELYRGLNGRDFENEINKPFPNHNFKTIHCNIFNGNQGYIITKNDVLCDIKSFVNESLELELRSN